VRIKGLSLQCEEKSSGERSSSLVIAFLGGMLVVYGTSEVCVHRKGR
jgi:hypothetical protein